MENLIRQTRVSFSEPGHYNNKDSFKDKKSASWLQRQFYDENSQNYESTDSEFVAAIAAATFAVHSFEEKTSSQHQKMAKTRDEGKKAEASMRNQTEKVASFARQSRSGEANNNTSLSIIHGSGNSKVDAWEKAQLRKIRKQYEKSNLTILRWENEKKKRAKRRVEEKQKEIEQKRAMNWQHYQNKLARIDHIAGGARSQLEDKRKNDESKVKDKAKKMTLLGISSPKYCFCCC